MKRLIAFLLVALIGWNIVLTILYLQSKEDTTAATVAQQTKQKAETADVGIISDVTELMTKSENEVMIVTVRAHGQTFNTGGGAVYKVDGKTIYIITNNRIVADKDEAIVIFANGKEQRVDIARKDELTDLALLRTDVDFKAEAFVVGNPSLVKEREYVITMGSPLGIGCQDSVSGGPVPDVDRRMEVDIDNNDVADWDMNVLQTDATINSGNSDRPLTSMAGELIDISSMGITNTSVKDFGFVLPVNEALPIIAELENDDKVIRPILGIFVQSVEQLSMLDKAYLGTDSRVESSLLIVEVASRIPTASVGIKEDGILAKFDGKEVKDYKQFRQHLYSHKVKDKVSIVVNRNGKEIEKTVILE